jgi:hypothetical protein
MPKRQKKCKAMYELIMYFITGIVVGCGLTVFYAGYFRRRTCPYADLIDHSKLATLKLQADGDDKKGESDDIRPPQPPIRP